MTDQYTQKKEELSRNTILNYIKFFLIPGWRDPEITRREFEIEKYKSKRRTFRRILTPLTISGFAIIFFILFLAIYVPWLTPYTQIQVNNVVQARLASPGVSPWETASAMHPLGTTHGGYDLLARIIWGARTSMIFGFIASTMSVVGGIIIGTISAYYGGKTDERIMRFIDLVMIFPATFIVILIIDLTNDPNIMNILVVFGLFGIARYARFMRACCLEIRKTVYIDAARTGGANDVKIMTRHLLPNAISPMIISYFGGVGAAILAFSGLAFLGFGDQALPDWGTDISKASYRLSSIYATIWPGLFILITVLGFMLVGDGLRDVFDPRTQVKHIFKLKKRKNK